MRSFCLKKCIIVIMLLVFVLSSAIVYADNDLMDGTESPSQNVFEKLQQDFDFKSKSAILVESKSGKILFEKNSREQFAPASITKIMSMLLFMEAIDSGRVKYDDVVSISEHAQSMGGSQIWLEPGEQMNVRDLMKAVVINSANDATVALAEHIAGSEEVFVRMMNEKAQQLGMKHTNYINCSGLDAKDHYMSAYDVALVSMELINKHPDVTQFTTVWMDSLRNGEFGLANTNKLIRYYKGANGIKTGSTSKAGFCLSASAKRDSLQLIAVVMAAPNSKMRFFEASKLLNYGFANYQSVIVHKNGELAGTVKVIKGIKSEVEAVYPHDVNILVHKGEKRNVLSELSLEEKIIAPIAPGQKVGIAIFKLEGSEIGRAEVVAMNAVEKATIIKLLSKMLNRWLKIDR